MRRSLSESPQMSQSVSRLVSRDVTQENRQEKNRIEKTTNRQCPFVAVTHRCRIPPRKRKYEKTFHHHPDRNQAGILETPTTSRGFVHFVPFVRGKNSMQPGSPMPKKRDRISHTTGPGNSSTLLPPFCSSRQPCRHLPHPIFQRP